MTRRGEVEVRWGYSLEHLDALARQATTRAFTATLNRPDAIDVAWCAIVEALYEATHPPTPAELLRAGTRAIHDDARADQQAHGVSQYRIHDGPGQVHRFAMYWWARSTPSPENGIVDRRALQQIWPLLKPWMQQAILTLAVHGNDYQAAADALGLNYQAYYQRLKKARTRFFAEWHQGETPSRTWIDRRPQKQDP
jgi:DNA-directed RNA polymerase specialized sigma24 family protein